MNESCFNISIYSENIYGIWHKSGNSRNVTQRNIAVVLLHGWAGYRTGPHDMLVKIARTLADNGYHCIRFDFRGKGYSQGDRQQINNKSMIEDLDAVLHYINHELNQPEITLAGICSGAKLALFYARNGGQLISHVVEMSSPVLRQNEVESMLATNKTMDNLKVYFQKAFRIETWRKLLHGEIQFAAIRRNISKPIYNLVAKKKDIPIPERKINNIKSEKDPFSNFQGQMLLIHGGKDPETKPALHQIHEMLHRYNILSDTYVIKNANHSFYSMDWERNIIQIITKWLNNKYY